MIRSSKIHPFLPHDRYYKCELYVNVSIIPRECVDIENGLWNNKFYIWNINFFLFLYWYNIWKRRNPYWNGTGYPSMHEHQSRYWSNSNPIIVQISLKLSSPSKGIWLYLQQQMPLSNPSKIVESLWDVHVTQRGSYMTPSQLLDQCCNKL